MNSSNYLAKSLELEPESSTSAKKKTTFLGKAESLRASGDSCSQFREGTNYGRPTSCVAARTPLKRRPAQHRLKILYYFFLSQRQQTSRFLITEVNYNCRSNRFPYRQDNNWILSVRQNVSCYRFSEPSIVQESNTTIYGGYFD